jgi:hypothetical protein
VGVKKEVDPTVKWELKKSRRAVSYALLFLGKEEEDNETRAL